MFTIISKTGIVQLCRKEDIESLEVTEMYEVTGNQSADFKHYLKQFHRVAFSAVVKSYSANKRLPVKEREVSKSNKYPSDF